MELSASFSDELDIKMTNLFNWVQIIENKLNHEMHKWNKFSSRATLSS